MLTPYLKSAFLVAVAWLSPVTPVALGLVALVALDTITGIWAAHRRKEKITSAGLRRGVMKTGAYGAVLLIAKVFAGFLVAIPYLAGIPAVAVAALWLALVELKSCNENLTSITGSNLLGSLIDKVGSKNDERTKGKDA